MHETHEVTDLVSPREAAAMLAVSPRTVARMLDAGTLEGIHLPSGHRRVLRASVDKLRAEVPA